MNLMLRTWFAMFSTITSFACTAGCAAAASNHPFDCTETSGTQELASGTFDEQPVELGSKHHRAVKLKSPAAFAMAKCPVVAASESYDGSCATPEGASSAMAQQLKVGDRYFIGDNAGSLHFYAWKNGLPDFLDIQVTPDATNTWLRGSDPVGNEYFIYLSPVFNPINKNLLKTYQVEMFYAGNKSCASERPDAKVVKNLKSGGTSGQGNTTGGPEPHHP